MKLPVCSHSLHGVGGKNGFAATWILREKGAESQTGHRAVGTTNPSSVVKREVMAGFLMGLSSSTQKLIFITLDCSHHDSKWETETKSMFSRDIYSQHFIILAEGSWVGRACSPSGPNGEGPGPPICHNKPKTVR